MKKFLGLFLILCVSNVFAVTVADAGPDQTICLSGVIQLQGNAPQQGEEGYWIDKDGVLGNSGSRINGASISGSPLNTGEYDLIYTITNGVDSTSDNLHLTIRDVPDMSNAEIIINDDCEGVEVLAEVINVVGVDTYQWEMISGGTISFSTIAEAMVELAVDGSISATIEVVATNTCGNSIPVQGSNVINIKPRQVPVISGVPVVCATKNYTYVQHTPTTDATSWEWVWDGTYKGSGTTLSLSPSDLTNSSGLISLTPTNICGAGDEAKFNIIIQQPTAPQVKLDFVGTTADGKACEDEEDLVVEVDGLFSNGGNNALYEYFVGTQSHGAASMNTDFRILQGNWKDGDQITVQMIPDTIWGCYTKSLATSSPITIVAKDEALCGPLNLDDDKNTGVVFYPNPASQSIQLSKEFGEGIIKIYNLEGQLELQESNVTEVNIEDLESGMYIIQVENERGIHSTKLIIE